MADAGSAGAAESLAAPRPFLDSPVEGYIFIRLALAVLLLVVSSATQWDEPHALIALPYEISGVAFLVMGVSAALVRRYKAEPWFLWSQMVVDTIFATALVSLSSGPQSSYFVLYFMSVVAAARLLPSLGVVFVAGLDVVAYTLVSVAGLLGWLGWDLSLDILVLYTQVLVRIFGLLLVGVLSVGLVSRGALLAQIQHTRSIELAHTNLLDQLPVAVLSTEGESISALNAAATALFGDVAGRQAREVLPDALLDGHDERISLGGEDRWLRCLRHPVGESGAVYIFEDVTRLREMEAQVEREERLAAVGRLAASLAHEIRNPLASLSGSVQLLEERKSNPLQRIILREVQRLNDLVEQFLQSSRPLELTFIQMPPGPIVEEVVTAFRNDPRCRDLRAVQLSLEETEAVRLDPARFRQVLWNLLVNAVQATQEGGHIRVVVRPVEDGAVEVAVQDDGMGIPPDKLLRIFDPFYTTRSGGTGLGLANVDRIVRAHAGEVRVESEQGAGTTFRIRLPQLGGQQGHDEQEQGVHGG